MTRELILVLTLAGGTTTLPVSIKVTPQVVMAGHSVRVTCSVPRRSENRSLSAGLVNVQSSDRQLDGDQSRIAWEFVFDHVPCDAELAFCAVHALTRDSLVTAPIQVAGCEQ